MMSSGEIRQLRAGDRIEWTGPYPGAGWVLSATPGAIATVWDGGESQVWPLHDEGLLGRIAEHLIVVKKGGPL